MDNTDCEWLAEALQRHEQDNDGTTEPGARQAGVLLLLYVKDGAPHLVFTRRTLHVALHKGEISLPGGAHEDSDASLLETAIRELGEELGVAAAGLKVLGRLPTVYTKVSNFAVNPYVAVASRRPCFRADPVEVAEVLEIPLQALCDPAALHEEENEWQGEKARMLFFQCGEHKIWGATARIVHEFLTVLGKPRRDNV